VATKRKKIGASRKHRALDAIETIAVQEGCIRARGRFGLKK
jgi:hypothetical protein